MSQKSTIYTAMFIGSSIFGLIPMLWGRLHAFTLFCYSFCCRWLFRNSSWVYDEQLKLPTYFSSMTNAHPNDPLYGKTLELVLTELVTEYTFEKLAEEININCFSTNPSIKSSLVFLRKTPWARKKVEELYIITLERKKHRAGI